MATSNTLATPSPAMLRDENGTPIVPLTPLPGVDFGAHLNVPASAAADGKESANDATTGYFPENAQESTKSNTAPLGPAKTEAVEEPAKKTELDTIAQDVRPGGAGLARTRTAPTQHRMSRSQGSWSHRAIVQNMRRNQQQYSYTFDPMMSDSSSSDSSEDEHEAHLRKGRGGGEKVGLSRPEDKRRKKDAKKGRSYSRFQFGNENFKSNGRVSKRDGRLSISINETANNGWIAKALGHSLKNHLDVPNARQPRKQRRYAADHPIGEADIDAEAESIASDLGDHPDRPKLNVVIIIIGSRGDIQPFIRIGQILKHEHGHRVRVATHATFRDFVEESGLEFFSVGGNPSELMAFMVKNPGLIPSMSTIRDGEIQRRRAQMGEMFEGMWRACTNVRTGETDEGNLKMMNEGFPFIADAIIANPPSMAPPHIVERLGIPLFMAFTFPYSPTQQFPHPLANIRPSKSNVDANYINFMSYPIVEMMTWQGLGDIVNKFRVNSLHLEPVSSLWAPGALYRMKVPYTYMWSPALIPKPSDWGPEIDITGFVFLDLASKFKPPQDLQDFLDAGEPPVYIGFGSIVVDDAEKFTKMIFDAVKMAGVRALVNKGWGGLGGEGSDVPDNIFMLGNTPHDWLFPRVKAVVHHGGAGTTAIGLKCGKPTMIVPFFGDQPFWGAEVAKHEAGALECIPYKKLTVERLAEGIKQCLTEEAQTNAKKLAESINAEGDGAANAVKSFHRSLPLAGRANMRCSILEDRVAVWQLRNSTLRLSALAAEILLQRGKIRRHDLKILRHCSWNDFDGPGEPITGAMGALTDSLYGAGSGVGMVPVRIAKHIKKRQEHEQKRKAIAQKKEEHKRKKAEAKGQAQGAAAKTEDDQNGDADAKDGEARPTATRGPTTTTFASELSAEPTDPLAKEIAIDVGTGFKKTGLALLTLPTQLYVAAAQGFHNAPRLWGDATVRKPTRITGVKSGFAAAGRELTYGVYDGWTGVVKQPIGGWKDGDTMASKITGFGGGVAKGLGGFVIKNVSAVVAPPAFIGKGVLVFCEKKAEGESSKKFIRKSHFTQGLMDLLDLRNAARNNPQKQEELKSVSERVNDGWKVYEEIWEDAKERYGTVGGNVISRLRTQTAKTRWAKSGALENVDAAAETLKIQREGGDMQGHFAQREKKMDIAESARAPAMEQPAEEGKDGILPNGRRLRSPDQARNAENDKKTDASRARQLSDADGSDTAVETPDEAIDDEKADTIGSLDAVKGGAGWKDMPSAKGRERGSTVGEERKKSIMSLGFDNGARPSIPRIATA